MNGHSCFVPGVITSRSPRRLGLGLSNESPVAETAALARQAEDLGFSEVWLPESGHGRGLFTVAASVAAATGSIRIGLGIVNPFWRHPSVIAMEAAALDEASGGRVMLGLGAAHLRGREGGTAAEDLLRLPEMGGRLVPGPGAIPLAASEEVIVSPAGLAEDGVKRSGVVFTLSANVCLAAIYLAVGKLGLMLAFLNASATAVWPPTGVALAALLLFGYRLWPGILATILSTIAAWYLFMPPFHAFVLDAHEVAQVLLFVLPRRHSCHEKSRLTPPC